MAHEIDIRDGSMHLANGLVLAHNTSVQQVLATGIAVHRDLDMKTGWRVVSIGPNPLLGKNANSALFFFNDELKQIHFALLEAGVTAPEYIRKIHDSVLIAEFGAPQVQDAQRMMYVFPWGNLVSACDPRGGQSEVVLSWK